MVRRKSILSSPVLINMLVLVVGVVSGVFFFKLTALFELFIAGLRLIIPLLIFGLVSVAIYRIAREGVAKKVTGFMVVWFLLIALVAGIFAGVFVLVFFPPQAMLAFSWSELMNTLKESLARISLDANFIAILLGLAFGYLAHFHSYSRLAIELSSRITERFIGLWKVALPILLFLGGNYIGVLSSGVGQEGVSGVFQNYVLISLLVFLAGILWQGIWLVIIKYKYGANLRQFLSYYIRVYPVAWSTCSETISMPVNIEASKKLKYLDPDIKKLSATLGSGLNTPGSVMCGVIFAVAIPALFFNIIVSPLQLIVIILLSSIILGASPGIPGELILLTGLVITVINPPAEIISSFTALWVGLQMGIPDGFRTAVNVTDDEIYASIFNHIKEKSIRFQEALKQLPVLY